MRKVIRTPDAPKPLGVYSQAIVSDGFVFVAGQIPVNPSTGELELGDVRSETRLVLRNIAAVLHAAGSSLADAVRMGVFACTLPKNIKVEIDCIAHVRRVKKRR